MKTSFSIDGFVSGPNGEIDWIFKSSDPTSAAWAAAQSMDASLIIMGRKSFEGMASFRPTASGPFAGPMNELPKALFTKNESYKGIPPIRHYTTTRSKTSRHKILPRRHCRTYLPHLKISKTFNSAPSAIHHSLTISIYHTIIYSPTITHTMQTIKSPPPLISLLLPTLPLWQNKTPYSTIVANWATPSA